MVAGERYSLPAELKLVGCASGGKPLCVEITNRQSSQ